LIKHCNWTSHPKGEYSQNAVVSGPHPLYFSETFYFVSHGPTAGSISDQHALLEQSIHGIRILTDHLFSDAEVRPEAPSLQLESGKGVERDSYGRIVSGTSANRTWRKGSLLWQFSSSHAPPTGGCPISRG
jgi:hypothetical protein